MSDTPYEDLPPFMQRTLRSVDIAHDRKRQYQKDKRRSAGIHILWAFAWMVPMVAAAYLYNVVPVVGLILCLSFAALALRQLWKSMKAQDDAAWGSD